MNFALRQSANSKLLGFYAFCVVSIAAITVESYDVADLNVEAFVSTKATTDTTNRDVIFNRDIRPILSNKCFACHGPDEASVQAGLRLDEFATATSELESGEHAVVPGETALSALVARIATEDPSERMPPVSFGKALSAEEIDTLTRWVAQGAKYQKHWSFEAIDGQQVAAAIPSLQSLQKQVAGELCIESPIDALVVQRAVEHFHTNVTSTNPVQSQRADKAILLRRVSLALTGLSPTIDEQDAFLSDSTPNAYEKVVDRLLESPQYGEHWARSWLDHARYADSNGYADDGPRTIWAYRDWVIRALNSNMPFDEFTRLQIAGDLYGDVSDDHLIATAFHRNTLTNHEGGTNDEEFRNVAVVDRVNTTLSVWMGLTMACAQCHTHKYDPISQRDYFQVFSIFNQSQDADRNDDSPRLQLFTDQDKTERQAIEKRLQELRLPFEDLKSLVTDETRHRAFESWVSLQNARPSITIIKPYDIVTKSGDVLKQDANEGRIEAESGRDSDTYELVWSVPPAVKLTDIHRFVLETYPWPKEDPKRFYLGEFRIAIETGDSTQPTALNWKILNARARDEADGRDAIKAIDGNQGTGWGASDDLRTSQWIDFFVESIDEASLEKLRGEATRPLRIHFTVDQPSTYLGHILGAFRLGYSTDAIDPAIERQIAATSIRKVALLGSEQRSSQQSEELERAYLRNFDPVLERSRSELGNAERRWAVLQPYTDLPIMRELSADNRRTTHIQIRGNYRVHGEEVQPGVLSSLHPLRMDHRSQGQSATSPIDRRDLAEWLIQTDNPLTARVIANRIWEQLFGTGLVRTSEDFGSQGDPPTHPELLDYLANQLKNSQWNIKQLLREIVLSATFKQSSAIHDSADGSTEVLDPENIFLTRGPRVRLTAEQVRDNSLLAAGLLATKMYGPPVRPVQPTTGLTAAFGGRTDWEVSGGEDKYRRAIYVSWRRSSPYASMTTFDAPNRENCILRRDRTNTPLQALVTMNDPTYIEAAQSLARKLISASLLVSRSSTFDDESIALAFRRVLCRQPSHTELIVSRNYLQRTRDSYAGDRASATKVVTEPLGPLPESLDVKIKDQSITVEELAAWTMFSSVMMNLDETIMPQ